MYLMHFVLVKKKERFIAGTERLKLAEIIFCLFCPATGEVKI